MSNATPEITNSSESKNQEISAPQNLQRNPSKGKGDEKADVYTLITDRIMELLEQGVIPWKRPWRTSSKSYWPMNLVSGKEYSGINAFLLAMTAFESPYFLTYKQARDMGGSIRKGAKGYPVIYCNRVTSNRKDEKTGEKEQKQYSFLRYYTVFNLEQTEGITAPVLEAPAQVLAFNPIEECERIANGYRGAPDLIHHRQRACYSPALDLINMPKKETFDSEAEYYGVLFHEMTHSTGHKTRLAREGITEGHTFGDESYGKEELIAEMGAAFLCAQANIAPATLNNSAAYIGSWLTKLRNDKKLVIQAASAAQKAANLILGEATLKTEEPAEA
ncbi:MAG: zincin-like metallopeptidase domain-containing protein [Fibrobacterota bacterium]|nr:zincin-like metallopeptidase domain-containing protein [Fibrobacterota bacterium]